MSAPTSQKGKKRLEAMIARGRRGSAAAIARIRSGSLPSWAGGPPAIINPQTPTIDEEHEFGFPYPTINDDETENEQDDDEIEPNHGNHHVMINVDEEGKREKSRVPRVAQMTRQRHEMSDPRLSRVQGNVDLGLVLSGMYAKLLVVMGIAFPLSEVISSYIPHRFYDGFYIYLYLVSILFMICILGNVVKRKAKRSAAGFMQRMNNLKTKFHSSTDSGVAPDVISNGHGCENSDESDAEADHDHDKKSVGSRRSGSGKHGHGNRQPERAKLKKLDSINSMLSTPSSMNKYHGHHRYHFGSFYLRMGAMAFGIGSMIYSGLEFGQYFELEVDTTCHNYMIALTPTVRMIFTFMQMYFIFLNSNMAIGKTSLGVQFGLMHMIGTNLCVWLNVLVEETRHEILHFYDPTNQTLILPHQGHGHGYTGYNDHKQDHHVAHRDSGNDTVAELLLQNATRVKRGLRGMYECRRSNIMGTLVNNASPFLFPCTIEYSLICAAICYVMWKSTAKRRAARYSTYRKHDAPAETTGLVRSPHHYTVDCAGSNKGLFLGIFVLVLTIMSLIINFVLHARPGYGGLAMLQVNVVEVVVYSITTLAVLLGMCQVRELRFDKGKNLELDNILLVVAQTGSLIYNVFTIIGAQFTTITDNKLVLMTALASLIQLLLQTLFIIDASKRTPATAEQANRKPGREVVTFLLVANLAMWLINTLENSRGDSHPLQLEFYGIWAWTIITDISMPLAIFYRFHSTVCLCEIWKKAYKIGKDREGRLNLT